MLAPTSKYIRTGLVVLLSLLCLSLRLSLNTTRAAESELSTSSPRLDTPQLGCYESNRHLSTRLSTSSASEALGPAVHSNQHGLIYVSVLLEKHEVLGREASANNDDSQEEAWKVTVDEVSTSSVPPATVDNVVTTMMSLSKELEVAWVSSWSSWVSLVDDDALQAGNDNASAHRSHGDDSSVYVGSSRGEFPMGSSSLASSAPQLRPSWTRVSKARATCSFVIPLETYSPSRREERPSLEPPWFVPVSAYASRTFVVSLWSTTTTPSVKGSCEFRLKTRRLATLPRVAHPRQTVDPVAKVSLQHSSSSCHHQDEQSETSFVKEGGIHKYDGSRSTQSSTYRLSWIFLSAIIWAPLLVGITGRIRSLKAASASQRVNWPVRQLENESEPGRGRDVAFVDVVRLLGIESCNDDDDVNDAYDANDIRPAFHNREGHGELASDNSNYESNHAQKEIIEQIPDPSSPSEQEASCDDIHHYEAWPREEQRHDIRANADLGIQPQVHGRDCDQHEMDQNEEIGIVPGERMENCEPEAIQYEGIRSSSSWSHGKQESPCNNKHGQKIPTGSYKTDRDFDSSEDLDEGKDENFLIAGKGSTFNDTDVVDEQKWHTPIKYCHRLRIPEKSSGRDVVWGVDVEENTTRVAGAASRKTSETLSNSVLVRNRKQRRNHVIATTELNSSARLASNPNAKISRIKEDHCAFVDISTQNPSVLDNGLLTKYQECLETSEYSQLAGKEWETPSRLGLKGKQPTETALPRKESDLVEKVNNEHERMKPTEIVEVMEDTMSPFCRISSSHRCDTGRGAYNESIRGDGMSVASNRGNEVLTQLSEVSTRIQNQSHMIRDTTGRSPLVCSPIPASHRAGNAIKKSVQMEQGNLSLPAKSHNSDQHVELMAANPRHSDNSTHAAEAMTYKTRRDNEARTQPSEAEGSYVSTLPPDSDYASDDDPFVFQPSDIRVHVSTKVPEPFQDLEAPSRTHDKECEYSLAVAAKEPGPNRQVKKQELLSRHGSIIPGEAFTDQENEPFGVEQKVWTPAPRKRSRQDSLDTDSVEITHVVIPISNKRGNRPYSKSNFVADWIPSNGLQAVSQHFMNEEPWHIAPAPDFLRSSGSSNVPKSIAVRGCGTSIAVRGTSKPEG
jgi:hypothetical protein